VPYKGLYEGAQVVNRADWLLTKRLLRKKLRKGIIVEEINSDKNSVYGVRVEWKGGVKKFCQIENNLAVS
jgi:hypothetical protein